MKNENLQKLTVEFAISPLNQQIELQIQMD